MKCSPTEPKRQPNLADLAEAIMFHARRINYRRLVRLLLSALFFGYVTILTFAFPFVLGELANYLDTESLTAFLNEFVYIWKISAFLYIALTVLYYGLLPFGYQLDPKAPHDIGIWGTKQNRAKMGDYDAEAKRVARREPRLVSRNV